MPFPYIKQIHVNDCFTYQNFDVPIVPLEDFRHIIFTGRNGSGKTTILNRVGFHLDQLSRGQQIPQAISQIKVTIQGNPNNAGMPGWKNHLMQLEAIVLNFLSPDYPSTLARQNTYLFSHYKANRRVEFDEVTTVVTEDALLKDLEQVKSSPTKSFTAKLKQYLVNKKIYEAFDIINKRTENIEQNSHFFGLFTEVLRSVLKDDRLELEFVQEKFDFYIKYSDGRSVTFNQLSEGFSSFISILTDLFIKADIIRKTKGDFSGDIEGIVLIDEPETHFHLSMQYEILPLISSLFPKVQLIIATHSPAVISSLKNAIVFDLTSKEEVADFLLGSSYSDLMIRHFGLDNEFSPIGDKIISAINRAVRNNNIDELKLVLEENESYLTPTLRLEIESQIIKIQSQRQAAND